MMGPNRFHLNENESFVFISRNYIYLSPFFSKIAEKDQKSILF